MGHLNRGKWKNPSLCTDVPPPSEKKIGRRDEVYSEGEGTFVHRLEKSLINNDRDQRFYEQARLSTPHKPLLS